MTSQLRDQTLGRDAYEAYVVQTGGRSLVTGEDLPPWDGLTGSLQNAWIAAARAVEAAVRERFLDDPNSA